MNTNWSKILLFSLLSLALGIVIGHMCTYMCMGGSCHHGGHGDMACCKEGGKEGCEHGGMKEGCEHGEGGKGACCMGEGHHGEDHEARIHTIVHGLKERNFQGDTTIKEEGCVVTIGMHGDKTEVKVEMSDSLKMEEKTVEVHAH
jgi:hypothetical protein